MLFQPATMTMKHEPDSIQTEAPSQMELERSTGQSSVWNQVQTHLINHHCSASYHQIYISPAIEPTIIYDDRERVGNSGRGQMPNAIADGAPVRF